MSTIVYRISVLLGAILADVPVGTNLGLFWLLWALISGRFLLSRGAVFPALADGGIPLGSGHLSSEDTTIRSSYTVPITIPPEWRREQA